MTDELTILQHNVNSWTNKKYELTNIYNRLNPDIILINDHAMTNDRRLKIFNYNIHSSNKSNLRHRGTAIAIRQDIQYRLHDDFDTDLLAITVQTRQGPITIATDYIPPNAPYLHYIDYLSLLNRQDPTYIIGDLNARHRQLRLTADHNPVGRAIANLINSDKCRHLGPTFPTYISHNSTTSPDIVLSNNKTFHNIGLRPGPMTSSDHIPIIATITCKPIAIPIKPRLQFSKANWDLYKDLLKDVTIPTEQNPTLEEIDNYLETWTKHIQDATDKAIPTITQRNPPGLRPDHEARLLEIQYNATIRHIYENGPTLQLNRQLTDLKLRLRRKYYDLQDATWNDIIDKLDVEPDATKFWKTINKMKGNNKQKIPYLKDHHNNKLDSPQDKERLFRDHWTKIFTNDDPDDNDFDHDHIAAIEKEVEDNFDKLRTYDFGDLSRLDRTCPRITKDELTKTLRQFKQKAPGPTKITTLQLRHLPTNMTDYLLYIFNQSLSAGYFPDSLKHARMIFLPKGNSSQYNIKNYRPISLLDIQGKLFDKILNTRFTHHIEQHNFTNTRQHGFRKHRGTHTALATFYETIANHKHHRRHADVVLRDVSKAFDKVWHTGLKHKILQLGLHTCFTRTLSDFITDRTATIQIDNYIGPQFTLDSGVPQGACLSPSLYNFYTHDIPPPIHDTDYIAFADDITQITTTPYNYKAIANTTKHAIVQINTFENKWKISTNKSKFTIVPISRNNTTDITTDTEQHYPYTAQGKILGLTFNSRGILPQVNQRKQLADITLNKLYRFKHLNTKNKLKLYTALVRSILTYPIVPLNTISNASIRKLQRTQNRAVRFITNTSLRERIPSQQLHEQLHLPAINTLIHTHAATTWENIKTHNPQLYNTLEQGTPTHNRNGRFPSSREVAEGPPPTPMYS